MSNILPLECSCKKIKGELKVIKKSSIHVHCMCCDCQSFAGFLNNKDKILDEYNASELLQAHPSDMKITQGQEYIKVVQQTKGGVLRWYAGCCNMPLANTMGANIPFVGVSVKLMKFENSDKKEEVLGPVFMKAFAKYTDNKPFGAFDTYTKKYIPSIVGLLAKGWITGKGSPSPFFENKKPIVKVEKLY